MSNTATPIGMPALAKMAFNGVDLAPLWNALVGSFNARPDDAAALLDLSTIAQLQGRPQDGLALQSKALALQRIYRRPAEVAGQQSLKLLAFMAPGDLMTNTPLEFLLEGSSIALDMMFVVPNAAIPAPPEHDVAMVAIDESDQTQPILREISEVLHRWPRPIINRPHRIARLTRSGVWDLLKSATAAFMPMNARIDRAKFSGVVRGDVSIEDLLGGNTYPIIARPFWSQGGSGLSKLESVTAVEDYLCKWTDPEFYIAPFIDYRSPDGLFRKYRIAMINGVPFACHMAISENWIVHYLSADMKISTANRAQESKFMATFDSDFAVKHATAFNEIADRIGLDYFQIDCSETPNGKLLVFEVGTAMIVHSMDSIDLFPYKRPQMKKVFTAFQAMVHAAGRASSC